MNLCYLGLGSNLKTPERQLRMAIAALRKLPDTTVLQVAPLYFNKAWGRKCLPDYCNTVVKIQTRLPPLSLLNFCQSIESKQGRQRKLRNAARTIDIDILIYQNKTLKHPRLVLPHPLMSNRDFVLVPLGHLN